MMKNFILALVAGFSILSGAQVPSTVAQGIQSIIPNSGAEQGVAKWGRFQTTLTNGVPSTAPAVCTTCSITFGVTSTGALSGKSSFTVASSAATTVGQGFLTNAFPITPSQQPQVLTLRANYAVTSGLTNVNLSGTTANSWAVYIYELPSGTWTQPTGAFGMTVVNGTTTPATFQPQSTTTSIRVAVVAVNATAGAHTILWDDFNLGVQSQSAGVAMTDDQVAVPVITNAAGTVAATKPTMIQDKIIWSRVGDKMHIKFVEKFPVSGGSMPTGCASIQIPGGYQADLNRAVLFTNSTADIATIGSASMYDAVNNTTGYAYLEAATRIGIRGKGTANNGANQSTQDYCWGTNGYAYGNGNGPTTIALDAWVPILGWSTNVSQSSDYDGRNLNFSGYRQAGQAIANAGIIALDPVRDAAGAWSNNSYVVQSPGDYLAMGSAGASAVNAAAYIAVNGVQINSNYWNTAPNGSTAIGGTTLLPNLKVGDVITLRSQGAFTWSGTSLGITYLGGKQIVQQAPSVAASYGLTAAQTVAAGAPIKYDTKVVDNQNICSTMSTTGLCTLSMPGTYEVSGIAFTNAAAGSTLYVAVNANPIGFLMTPSNTQVVGGSVIFSALQGQTVGIYSDVNSTTFVATGSRGFLNRFNIKRIGN